MSESAAEKPFISPWSPLGRRRDRAFADQAEAARQAAARGADKKTLDFELKSTDFRAAAARNVRKTAWLIVLLAVIAVVLGYVAGLCLEILTGAHPALNDPNVPPTDLLFSGWGGTAAVAMAIAFVVALVWAQRSADATVLKLHGAVEADPQKDAVLHNVVEEVAIAAGLPKPAVYVVESEALNAFATGFKPERAAVSVTRGLLDRLNREELQGVVAHEMAHIGNRDVRLAVTVAMIVGLIAILSSLLRNSVRVGSVSGTGIRISSSRSSSRGGKGGASGLALVILVVGIIIIILAPIFALLVRMAISREREYLADATAAGLTRNPKGLASALAKIADNPRVEKAPAALEHVWIESPVRAYGEKSTALFSTHPPTAARIERLLDLR